MIDYSVAFSEDDVTETALFHEVIALLPALQALGIRDVLLKSSPSYFATRDEPLPSLKRLVIDTRYRKQTDYGVADIVGCFSSVEEVDAGGIFNNDTAVRGEPSSPHDTRIRTFRYTRMTLPKGDIFHYLRSTPSVHSLRSLETGHPQDGTASLNQLMISVGPNLEHLGYVVNDGLYPEDMVFRVPDLSPCTGLRTVKIRCYFNKDTPASERWKRLTDMIQACQPCSRLQDITIEIEFERLLPPNRSSQCKSAIAEMGNALLDVTRSTALSEVRFTGPNGSSDFIWLPIWREIRQGLGRLERMVKVKFSPLIQTIRGFGMSVCPSIIAREILNCSIY